MQTNKKLFTSLAAFVLMLFSCDFVFAISEETQAHIDEFMNLRMVHSTFETRDEAVTKIKDFERAYVSQTRETYGEMEAQILENFIVMELFNVYYDNPPMSKTEFRKMLSDQKSKNEAFINAHKDEKLNVWYWVTSGDVFSCWTTFSVKDILFYGMDIKNYYLSAYEDNPKCSYLLTNLAQWYFQAPKIGGGSNSKARSYFEEARNCAKNDAEKYFADIFLSQFLFEQKEFDRAAELLNEADSLNPGSKYIALIKAQNKAGRSLYQYNRKRSAVYNQDTE